MSAGKSTGGSTFKQFDSKYALFEKAFFVLEECASLWQQYFLPICDKVFHQFIYSDSYITMDTMTKPVLLSSTSFGFFLVIVVEYCCQHFFMTNVTFAWYTMIDQIIGLGYDVDEGLY